MRTVSIWLFFVLIACSENKTSRVDFMIGTWKTEGKQQYEVWEIAKNKELIGYSYKINNNQKTITETLTIKKIADQVIYEATVPDQNEGKTIRFTLNTKIKTYVSFENLEHDFPKKIQYESINDHEIKVRVLGANGEGFSYTQFRQKIK